MDSQQRDHVLCVIGDPAMIAFGELLKDDQCSYCTSECSKFMLLRSFLLAYCLSRSFLKLVNVSTVAAAAAAYLCG